MPTPSESSESSESATAANAAGSADALSRPVAAAATDAAPAASTATPGPSAAPAGPAGPSAPAAAVAAPAAPGRENLLLNIICNIAAPSLILIKFSSERWLGPAWGLGIALAFPTGYGLWDFARRRQANFISIIGFASVLLTGGLGLMKLDGFWFAVKEAAVPSVIGLSVLLSARTKRPLVKTIIYNDQVLDTPRVDAALAARGRRRDFETLLARSSRALAGTFLVSAILNFALARHLLKSPPGTEAFNAELGRMNVWSWPVIVVPSMVMLMFVLWKLIGGIQRLTGLEQEQIFRGGKK
ncbi:MAG: MFS transporter [Opitutaceae bacterium]|jgi:hypothetical protein|nr:MFS transporter [Opitutaceae bacterium]